MRPRGSWSLISLWLQVGSQGHGSSSSCGGLAKVQLSDQTSEVQLSDQTSEHCCMGQGELPLLLAIRSSWPSMRSTGPSAEISSSQALVLSNNVLGAILTLFIALLAFYCNNKQFSFQPLCKNPVYANSLMTTCGILLLHNWFTYLHHLKSMYRM